MGSPTTSPISWRTELKILPTFAVTLASPGMWIAAPEFGVDYARLLHVEQAARFMPRFRRRPTSSGGRGFYRLPIAARDAGRC